MSPTNPQPSSLSPQDAAAIDAFLERAWSEHGLADNTLTSYRHDLEGLARWLGMRGHRLDACTRETLHRYFAERAVHGGTRGRGYSARSNARLTSTLRHFFRLRLRQGAIA